MPEPTPPLSLSMPAPPEGEHGGLPVLAGWLPAALRGCLHQRSPTTAPLSALQRQRHQRRLCQSRRRQSQLLPRVLCTPARRETTAVAARRGPTRGSNPAQSSPAVPRFAAKSCRRMQPRQRAWLGACSGGRAATSSDDEPLDEHRPCHRLALNLRLSYRPCTSLLHVSPPCTPLHCPALPAHLSPSARPSLPLHTSVALVPPLQPSPMPHRPARTQPSFPRCCWRAL